MTRIISESSPLAVSAAAGRGPPSSLLSAGKKATARCRGRATLFCVLGLPLIALLLFVIAAWLQPSANCDAKAQRSTAAECDSARGAGDGPISSLSLKGL